MTFSTTPTVSEAISGSQGIRKCFKVHFNQNETHWFYHQLPISFKEFTKEIHLTSALTFEDDEGDKCSVTNEIEWLGMLEFFESSPLINLCCKDIKTSPIETSPQSSSITTNITDQEAKSGDKEGKLGAEVVNKRVEEDDGKKMKGGEEKKEYPMRRREHKNNKPGATTRTNHGGRRREQQSGSNNGEEMSKTKRRREQRKRAKERLEQEQQRHEGKQGEGKQQTTQTKPPRQQQQQQGGEEEGGVKQQIKPQRQPLRQPLRQPRREQPERRVYFK